MKHFITIITVLTLSSFLYSQDLPKKIKKTATENSTIENKNFTLQDNPVIEPVYYNTNNKNSLLFYGGYHSYLYGYKDKRYVNEEDQGDFLKAVGQYYGVEYSHLGFGKDYPQVENVRIGGLMNFYYRGSLPSKKLYAVSGHSIPAVTILPDANDRAQNSRLKVGIFGGLDDKWYEISAGIHANLEAEYEKERLIYAEDSSPSSPKYKSTSGRGWVWSNSAMRVNFLARAGLKESVNFTISIFREDYDPNYGKIMAKIFFPINDYFKMQAGAFLYPTDAVFIQPVLTYNGISLSPRFGLIINYRDDDFKKVGIFEGMFMSLSASYIW